MCAVEDVKYRCCVNEAKAGGDKRPMMIIIQDIYGQMCIY